MPIYAPNRNLITRLHFRQAHSEKDFEQIFRMNHKVFSDEIGQHPSKDSGELIDAHHDRNTYFVCENFRSTTSREQPFSDIVGMIALTKPLNGKFNVDKKMRDASALDAYRSSAAEIRLFCVDPAFRSTRVFLGLIQIVAQHACSQGARFAIISAIESQMKLYARIGFLAVGQPVKSGKGAFTPMVLSLEDFLEFQRRCSKSLFKELEVG
jgi:hypothetical protein